MSSDFVVQGGGATLDEPLALPDEECAPDDELDDAADDDVDGGVLVGFAEEVRGDVLCADAVLSPRPSALAVSTASTTSSTSNATSTRRRRQYTDGGCVPTG